MPEWVAVLSLVALVVQIAAGAVILIAAICYLRDCHRLLALAFRQVPQERRNVG